MAQRRSKSWTGTGRRNLLLSAQEWLRIVPKSLASFQSPEGVTLMTTTPQPTDHHQARCRRSAQVEP